VTGAEDLGAVVRQIVVRGTDAPNDLYSMGCDVTFRGRGGPDSVLMKTTGIGDEQPFTCAAGEFRRAFGQGGRDHLRGGRGHDELFGGPGRDTVYGGPAGDDVCVAEVVTGRGCLA
jgi:Ca2+-binding RTX toxin-like protein